jgi:hypothetical protein
MRNQRRTMPSTASLINAHAALRVKKQSRAALIAVNVAKRFIFSEISKLQPIWSSPQSADVQQSNAVREPVSVDVYGRADRGVSRVWKSESPSTDRRRYKTTSSAAESVLRGFRNLRNFWLSPKLSRRSIDDDSDDDFVDTTGRASVASNGGTGGGGGGGGGGGLGASGERPADVVRQSSLPHVLEQPSPAEDIPLPASVRKFTMDEFTRVFGPCRQSFSLPASPLRKKRLSTTSTTSTTSSTAEPDWVGSAVVGNGAVSETESVGGAPSTPSFTRRVTFRLDGDASDAASIGDDENVRIAVVAVGEWRFVHTSTGAVCRTPPANCRGSVDRILCGRSGSRSRLDSAALAAASTGRGLNGGRAQLSQVPD